MLINPTFALVLFFFFCQSPVLLSLNLQNGEMFTSSKEMEPGSRGLVYSLVPGRNVHFSLSVSSTDSCQVPCGHLSIRAFQPSGKQPPSPTPAPASSPGTQSVVGKVEAGVWGGNLLGELSLPESVPTNNTESGCSDHILSACDFRQALVDHYSKLSAEAARREQKALWRIQRHRLESARLRFLLEDQKCIQVWQHVSCQLLHLVMYSVILLHKRTDGTC